jgi:hypothetical protein
MRPAFILLFVTLLSIVFVACGDDEDTIQSTGTEEYTGYYLVRHKTIIGNKDDSLSMVLQNSRSYTIDFYPITGTDVNFCDHTGQVADWGSPTSRFTPLDITVGGCDAVRLPNGTFQANWTDSPDSIVFTRETTDSLWRLVLIPQ